MYRAKESLGALTLWNARELSEDLRNSIGANYDLNEGMLFVNAGHLFHGADAVHALALVTSGSTYLNRLNASIFRSQTLSKMLYPLLKLGRRLTLFLRGKSKISCAIFGRGLNQSAQRHRLCPMM